MKIAFSFFLLIYSRCGAPASWAARHTIVCLDLWRCLIFLSVRVDPVSHNDLWCPFPTPSTMPVCNTLTDMVPNHKTEEASTLFLQLLFIFRYLTYLMTASRIMVSLTMNTSLVTGATTSSRKSRSGR